MQTRKLYTSRPVREAREEAQRCADQDQRPVAAWFYSPERYRFTVQPRYRFIEDVKKRNAAAGNYWFQPSTMRFFASRVQSALYMAKDGRAYFVSSERNTRGNHPRLYTVRVAGLDGDIGTVGEFQGHTTARQAHAAARKASEGGAL